MPDKVDIWGLGAVDALEVVIDAVGTGDGVDGLLFCQALDRGEVFFLFVLGEGTPEGEGNY